jgi:orotidine-5'-phosphate decarboxylase
MPEIYFLGLDYPTDQIVPVGMGALDFLKSEFGDALSSKMGVKINDYALRRDFGNYKAFKDAMGCKIFGDIKICHGKNTGYRIIEEVAKDLPLDFVTVSSSLGSQILKEYVSEAAKDGIKIIGFTVHTKIPKEDVRRVHGRDVSDAIYELAQIAHESGCDAIVCEGKMLEDPRITSLPIKKLVTGIRIDPVDKGAQARATSLEQLRSVRPNLDYAVISERYLNPENFDKLGEIIRALE